MHSTLVRNWWAFVIRGVLAIVFGLIALFAPGVTMLSLVIVFAAYAATDGVFAIVSAVRAANQGERWGWLALAGVAGIAAGIAAIMWPGLTVALFIALIAVWALVSGGFLLAAAFRLDADHGRWWMVLGAVASLVYGTAASARADDRRAGADLVDRRLCDRVRHLDDRGGAEAAVAIQGEPAGTSGVRRYNKRAEESPGLEWKLPSPPRSHDYTHGVFTLTLKLSCPMGNVAPVPVFSGTSPPVPHQSRARGPRPPSPPRLLSSAADRPLPCSA